MGLRCSSVSILASAETSSLLWVWWTEHTGYFWAFLYSQPKTSLNLASPFYLQPLCCIHFTILPRTHSVALPHSRLKEICLRNRDQFFGIFSVISTILEKYGNSWWQWSMVMINDDDMLVKSQGSRFSVPLMPLFYPFPPLLCFGFCYCLRVFAFVSVFCSMILYVYSMSLHS